MWVILGIASSFFLGIYDIFKKTSLKDNAVIPVLFFATLTGALVFIPLIIFSHFFPVFSQANYIYIPKVDIIAHLLFFVKAVIVSSSWILAYFAIKHLPITIVTPIRASAPLWVLIGALTIFGEKLTTYQWVGLIITLIFYYLFSLAGKKEGIEFRTNKWIIFIVVATLIGAISGLYDKYLTTHYDRMALQAYFSVYLVIVLFPVLIFFWYPKRTKIHFKWHFAIPLIGISLILADFLYFYSLSYDESLISILSTIRRGSVITSFVIGSVVFKEEKHKRLKGAILIGILAGIILIMNGSFEQ